MFFKKFKPHSVWYGHHNPVVDTKQAFKKSLVNSLEHVGIDRHPDEGVVLQFDASHDQVPRLQFDASTGLDLIQQQLAAKRETAAATVPLPLTMTVSPLSMILPTTAPTVVSVVDKALEESRNAYVVKVEGKASELSSKLQGMKNHIDKLEANVEAETAKYHTLEEQLDHTTRDNEYLAARLGEQDREMHQLQLKNEQLLDEIDHLRRVVKELGGNEEAPDWQKFYLAMART